MRVTVWVRDTPISVYVGPGNQRLKWLAMVAAQRYEAQGGAIFSLSHVPTGLVDGSGVALAPNKSIRVALEDEAEVYLLVQADEDPATEVASARGTSKFLLTQGAAPSECLLDSHSLSYALVGQPVNFYLTARDTYGNLARNGGENFKLAVSGPTDVAYSRHADEGEHETPPPEIDDQGTGTYIITQTLGRPGRYELSVTLDGEPIKGSPFVMSCVQAEAPRVIKWLMPRVGGPAPSPFDRAASVAHGHTIVLFGGTDGNGGYHNEVRLLPIDTMKWELAKCTGTAPSPRAGCATTLAVRRMLIYGGEGPNAGVNGAPPLSSLFSLDLDSMAWTQEAARGATPGPVRDGAAAAVGSQFYLFGGHNGERLSNTLNVYSLSTGVWDFRDDSSGTPPEPRMGHSMTAVGARLIVFGGRTGATNFTVLSSLGIYDLATETWSSPVCRGEVPRDRWGHSACLWGRSLVLGLGADADRDLNDVSLLNLDTLVGSGCEGGVSRSGQALHLVEGKFLLLGGSDGGTRSADVQQANLGGFMINFDGVDDVIMIPHLPTIVPNAYTIEAWVRPASQKPMNIIVRSDESYPDTVWSHQLRINAHGKLEHYLETDDSGEERHTVTNSVPVQPGQWYHVAGVAQAGGEMKLIVNGKEEGQSVDVPSLRQKLDRYFVGAASGDNMGMFEGSIAEMRVWNYALSEGEIYENMRRVLTGTERGIVGYWRINEGPGAMVFDQSSYGNIGPINGCVRTRDRPRLYAKTRRCHRRHLGVHDLDCISAGVRRGPHRRCPSTKPSRTLEGPSQTASGGAHRPRSRRSRCRASGGLDVGGGVR